MGLKLADLGALTLAFLILKLELGMEVPQELFLSLCSRFFGSPQSLSSSCLPCSPLALFSAEMAMKLGCVSFPLLWSSFGFFFLFGLLSLWTPR